MNEEPKETNKVYTQAPAAPVLDFQDVSKLYRGGDFWRPIRHQALKNVTFTVAEGQVFGLVGANGAGKSTLMKCAVGLLRPDSGKILIRNTSPDKSSARRNFGYLPELPSFPGYLNAEEVLDFYGKLYGMRGAQLKRRIAEVLELVNLSARKKSPIREYSKGMQQRVGLAQTLLHDPDLLFLDEPMTGLDPVGIKEMRDIMMDLKSQGKTIFFNTHILAEVERICDRVGLMAHGTMRLVASVAELIAKNQSTVILGVLARDLKTRKTLRDLNLGLKEENNLWTLQVPNVQLADTLRKLEQMRVPTPSILSYGSPLETAFLKEMKNSHV